MNTSKKKTKQIFVTLDVDILAELDRIATEKGLRASQVIRMVVVKAYNKGELV